MLSLSNMVLRHRDNHLWVVDSSLQSSEFFSSTSIDFRVVRRHGIPLPVISKIDEQDPPFVFCFLDCLWQIPIFPSGLIAIFDRDFLGLLLLLGVLAVQSTLIMFVKISQDSMSYVCNSVPFLEIQLV